ncbi:MAG: histidinol-phosphatase HisJ family protein [Oscillospiraceae bacterium]|nr:histidinol-phosphatase HisJ family protein [Oscillospiraceae bacterium]
MYDYHVHTSFSPDSRAAAADVMERAAALGLREIALTDHYNPKYPKPDFINEPLSADDFSVMCALGEQYAGRVRLVKGIENGIQLDAIEENTAAARMHPYDFVMASFHSMGGCPLSEHRFFDGRTAAETYLYYYNYIYEALCAYTDFDVLGHINLLERYYDENPAVEAYWEPVERILRLLAARGQGLEINTSNMRYGRANVSLPTKRMLEAYRRFGGETVTIGSDAHKVQDIGAWLKHGTALLESAGFRYFATFKDRKPSHIKLSDF